VVPIRIRTEPLRQATCGGDYGPGACRPPAIAECPSQAEPTLIALDRLAEARTDTEEAELAREAHRLHAPPTGPQMLICGFSDGCSFLHCRNAAAIDTLVRIVVAAVWMRPVRRIYRRWLCLDAIVLLKTLFQGHW